MGNALHHDRDGLFTAKTSVLVKMNFVAFMTALETVINGPKLLTLRGTWLFLEQFGNITHVIFDADLSGTHDRPVR